MRAILVAGTHSGVGKTTVTLALIAGLRGRGLRVGACKVGPDFLDPAHLAAATGSPCHNLDAWMMGRELCARRLAAVAADADVAVVEGMMGLYDGRSGSSDEGSAAQLAKWLGLPVVLVCDASGGTRSLAATVLGFQRFDPGVLVAGVVFNRTGGAGHAEYLRAAMAAVPEVAMLGAVPSDAGLHLPERHLGLALPAAPRAGAAAAQSAAAGHLDLDRVLALAVEVAPAAGAPGPAPARPQARLGVARDEAFCFYYPDNLELLRQAGLELVEFSPLRDGALPPGLGGIYLGGGYPELHAAGLSANVAMRRAVRDFAADGGMIYAECGGLMYLAQSLDGLPMAGVLPAAVAMERKLQALGYREVRAVALEAAAGGGSAALHARGHEFHYSRLERGGAAPPAHHVTAPDGSLREEGFHCGRVIASYVHLHFGSCPAVAARLAEMAAHPR